MKHAILCISAVILLVSCKNEEPPPPLAVTIELRDYIGYACVTNPVDAAYNAHAELKIQITGDSKPEFSRSYSFYGQNSALDPQGNCVSIEIPEDDAFTATGALYVKGTSNCQAAPDGYCQKWFKVESFPAITQSVNSCPSPVKLTIDQVDPAIEVPCNL